MVNSLLNASIVDIGLKKLKSFSLNALKSFALAEFKEIGDSAMGLKTHDLAGLLPDFLEFTLTTGLFLLLLSSTPPFIGEFVVRVVIIVVYYCVVVVPIEVQPNLLH